jgi:hypothetical protein
MERKDPRVKKLKRKDLSKRRVVPLEKSANGLPKVKSRKPHFKNAFLPYQKTFIDKLGDKIKEITMKSAKGAKSLFLQVTYFCFERSLRII